MKKAGLLRVVLVIAGGWLVVTTALLVLAWRDIGRGLDEVRAVERTFAPADLATARPEQRLRDAASSFSSAESKLGSPLVAPMRLLPVVGRHVRVAEAMTETAEEVTAAGATSTRVVRNALDGARDGASGRVAAVREVLGALDDVDGVLAGADLGPPGPLFPFAAERHAEAVEALGEAREAVASARRLTETVRALVAGPSRYLVVAANNAEMRAGSGMFLSIGVLETENGELRLGEVRPAHTLVLEGEPVDMDDDVERLWGFAGLGTDWRNLGLSPRFATSAEAGARMWERVTGQPVDGVLALDVAAVVSLLDATGPVEAGDRRLSADDAEEYLLHDQYETIVERRRERGRSQEERREVLGDLASTIVERIESGDADVARVAEALRGAARGRHVLAWAADAEVQAGWVAAGVSGDLTGESMLLALSNRGGNKLDPFMRLGARVVSRPTGDETRVEVTVTVRNQTPSGEPAYIAGPHPDVPVEAGTYVGLLSLTMPGDATDISVDGAPLVTQGRDGPTVVAATQVVLARRSDLAVTYAFTLPGREPSVRIEPGARLPTSRWTVEGRTRSDRVARTIRLERDGA